MASVKDDDLRGRTRQYLTSIIRRSTYGATLFTFIRKIERGIFNKQYLQYFLT